MPCYDARDTWSTEHSHQAAALLCALLKSLRPGDIPWTPELRQWQDDHENMDAYYERKSKEPRR